MADADDVRRVALSLPHVEEVDSDGFDFRVGNKGFVWSYPERRPGERRRIRTDIAVLFVGDEAEKQALLQGEPDTFFSTPGYDGWPLVMLRLDAVDVDRLTELVTDAWRMRAPADLERDLREPREEYRFDAPLWLHDQGSWVFVTVPAGLSAEIRMLPRPSAGGFGSVKVEVRIGASRWSTSLFPDARSGCYVLPVKKPVRRSEQLEVGDRADVRLRLVG
jgi:hypothetical protein